MKQGDHVKVIGKDGFYVFLREMEGTAILRAGGMKNVNKPALDVPMARVVSLEPAD